MSVKGIDEGLLNGAVYGFSQFQDEQVVYSSSEQTTSASEIYSQEIEQKKIEIQGYDSEVTEITSSISNMTTNINNQLDIISDCSSQIFSLKAQIASLSIQDFGSKLWNGIKSLFGVGDDEARKKAEQAYNTQKAALESKIGEWEAKKSAAETKKTSYENEKKSLEQKKKDIEQKKTTTETEIKTVEAEKAEAIKQEQAELQKTKSENQHKIGEQSVEGVDEKDINKQIVSELDAQIESLEAELQAAKDGRGIGGHIVAFFGGGTTAQENELEEKKQLLAAAKEDSSKLAEAYSALMGEELTPEKLSQIEESLAVSNSLTSEQKEEIKKQLQKQAASLSNDLEKSVDGQGIISKGIGKINNFLDIGSTEKESKQKIEAYQKMVENLDPDSPEFAAQYKAITGEEFTIESLNSLMDGDSSKVGGSFASESICDFEETQEAAIDAVAGTVSGIASAVVVGAASVAGVVAAPFTAGASLGMVVGGVALAGTVGAAVNTGIKAVDGFTSEDGYSLQEAGKDLLSGAFNGIVGVVSSGAGSAVTKKIASAAAKDAITTTASSWAKNTAINAGSKLIGESVEGFIDGSASAGGAYILDWATAEDKSQYSLGDFAKTTLTGGAFGTVTSVGMSLTSQVIGGGFHMIKNTQVKNALEGAVADGADSSNWTSRYVNSLSEGLKDSDYMNPDGTVNKWALGQLINNADEAAGSISRYTGVNKNQAYDMLADVSLSTQSKTSDILNSARKNGYISKTTPDEIKIFLSNADKLQNFAISNNINLSPEDIAKYSKAFGDTDIIDSLINNASITKYSLTSENFEQILMNKHILENMGDTSKSLALNIPDDIISSGDIESVVNYIKDASDSSLNLSEKDLKNLATILEYRPDAIPHLNRIMNTSDVTLCDVVNISGVIGKDNEKYVNTILDAVDKFKIDPKDAANILGRIDDNNAGFISNILENCSSNRVFQVSDTSNRAYMDMLMDFDAKTLRSGDSLKILNVYEDALSYGTQDELINVIERNGLVNTGKVISNKSFIFDSDLVADFDLLSHAVYGDASPELQKAVGDFKDKFGINLHVDNNLTADKVLALQDSMEKLLSQKTQYGKLPTDIYFTDFMPQKAGGGFSQRYNTSVSIKPSIDSNAISHEFYHEVGHMNDFNAKKGNYYAAGWDIKNPERVNTYSSLVQDFADYDYNPKTGIYEYIFNDESAKLIENKISGYGATNTKEFIAEISYMMQNGTIATIDVEGKDVFLISKKYINIDGKPSNISAEEFAKILKMYFSAGGITYNTNNPQVDDNFLALSIDEVFQQSL